MGIIFKKLDREWLSNLRVFSNILEPSVISTENIVHQKFLKMCPNIPTSEFNEILDNLYTMICRNDVGFNYYSEDKLYVLIQTYYYTIIKQLLKISENVTKNSRFTNIKNIRNRIINIDKKDTLRQLAAKYDTDYLMNMSKRVIKAKNMLARYVSLKAISLWLSLKSA